MQRKTRRGSKYERKRSTLHKIPQPKILCSSCLPTSQPTFETHVSRTCRKTSNPLPFASANSSNVRSQLFTVSPPNIPACRLTTSSNWFTHAFHSCCRRGRMEGISESWVSGGWERICEVTAERIINVSDGCDFAWDCWWWGFEEGI